MKIGITGARGFVGWHLRCYLRTRNNVDRVELADRTVFQSDKKLRDFVDGLDLIVHLAGVNRADDDELVRGNVEPAKQLVAALEATSQTPFVVYTSSIQAGKGEHPYAIGKAAVSELFSAWSKRTGGLFANLIVPHVFGEYGRPYYNSAIATFAHQIANGEKPSIHNDGRLELIHVQDLVEKMISCYREGEHGDIRIEGRETGVVEAANKLQEMNDTYRERGHYPDIQDHFSRCMFNTLRGAIAHDERNCRLEKHVDERGWLIEAVKAQSGGQCFVSTTAPGITRGNHFHLRKVERFLVLKGKAHIKLRKLFDDKTIVYKMDGEAPAFVDIPTLHTHSITNVGDSELITLFWADEFFDPENPDTTYEEV